MNTRILLLAAEADIYANCLEEDISMTRDEKFAELIIEKCIQQCQVVAKLSEVANTTEVARKTAATANSCAFFIKSYFK